MRDDAQAATELIRLLRISQNSAVIIDSDRRNSTHGINSTKARVEAECAAANVMCWITEGREIENYLTPESVAAAYEEMTGERRTFSLPRYGKIEKIVQSAYGDAWKDSWAYERYKPEAARRIAAKIDVVPAKLDLRKRIDELVTRIRAAC